ncbi:MAG: methyltransferase [Deltaproteobacteria bacterium]|jgi:hypothetical protein|nr:methyltransferase [Deltaproteobacteria bacterium]
MADLVTPAAIRVAAALRIADHLVAGLRSADEIADVTDVESDALERLMRHLASVGLLEREPSGGFSLTPAGHCLTDEHPSGLRRILDVEGPLGRAEQSFAGLLHSIRTGEPSFPGLHGHGFWEDLAADPARARLYDAQMGADARQWARQLVDAFDWASLGHVVDVGGGDGSLLAALLVAHPSLRGTVFDQPRTAEAARATLTRTGVAERGRVVGGSFFDALPSGSGGYLLSAILHDWSDEAARTILRRCAEAAGSKGRVLVVEKTGPDGESERTEMDLRMLVVFGGKERGVRALSALAQDAGLRVVAVHPAGDLAIVELTPDPARRGE